MRQYGLRPAWQLPNEKLSEKICELSMDQVSEDAQASPNKELFL